MSATSLWIRLNTNLCDEMCLKLDDVYTDTIGLKFKFEIFQIRAAGHVSSTAITKRNAELNAIEL